MEILKVNDSPVVTTEPVEEVSSSEHFIAANTKLIGYNELRNKCIIPVFRDNESTVSHQEFLGAVQTVVQEIYSDKRVLEPCIRVSHPIRGRIPSAVGKPANQLSEHEKTLYWERCGFIISIPEIRETVNGNSLNLTVGGVRSYSLDNLRGKKTEEHFKVFIGFKNLVCTNLCVSTDGYMADVRVRSLHEEPGVYS